MFRLGPAFPILRIAASLCLVATHPQTGVAQDAQYWTYQYGTRANLLSGAVVGSVVDISAAYYNPGALALIDEPDIIAATKVLELSNLILDPDVGIDVDLDNLRFDFAPGFIAGLLPFGFLGDNVLAYSIFTRHLFKATLDEVRVGSLDGESLQGDFFAAARFSRDMREDWFGLSWSTPFMGKLGIGVSNFFTYRNQKGSNRVQTQLLDETGGMALDLSEESYSYWDARVLWKAGVTFDWLGASLGLTVTTPSLDLVGSGKCSR